MEYEKKTMGTRFKNFTKECARVLRVTRKPTKFEFRTIVKVTGIGILAIGFIGFVITLVLQAGFVSGLIRGLFSTLFGFLG